MTTYRSSMFSPLYASKNLTNVSPFKPGSPKLQDIIDDATKTALKEVQGKMESLKRKSTEDLRDTMRKKSKGLLNEIVDKAIDVGKDFLLEL